MLSANAIKAKGTKIFSLGVGSKDAISTANLKGISGPRELRWQNVDSNVFDADWMYFSRWNDLGEQLSTIAKGVSCDSYIKVKKTLEKADGSRTPGIYWKFSLEKTAGHGNVKSYQYQWTDYQGITEWPLGFDKPDSKLSLKLSEVQQPGWSLKDVTCSTKTGEYIQTKIDKSNGTVDIKNIGLDQNVSCEFVNSQTTTDLLWEKVDNDDNNTHLSGSEWQLKNEKSGKTLTIKDCVSDQCAGDLRDVDSRPGYFKVIGLEYGSYKLIETKAPEGWIIDNNKRAHDVKLVEGYGPKNLGKITNSKAKGSVKWQKQDFDGHALGGSVWTLVGSSPQTNMEIEDCVSNGACGRTRDKDPRPGFFEVTDLALGQYTVTEKRAPVGYVINQKDKSRNFTISTSERNIDLTGKPFKNDRVNVPSIPLTGGSSTDAFLITGAGLLFLSLLVVGIRRKFNKA